MTPGRRYVSARSGARSGEREQDTNRKELRLRKKIQTTLIVLICAGVLAAIVHHAGWRETIAALQEAGPVAFVGMGALLAAFLALQAGVVALLNRPIGLRIPFHLLFRASILGLAANIVTPSTYLGGEPVKVLYVCTRTGVPVHRFAGTILLAKYLEALSFALVSGVTLGIAMVSAGKSLFAPGLLPVGIAAVVLMLLLIGGAVLLLVALERRWKPFTAFGAGFLRVLPRTSFLLRLYRRACQMETQVLRVYREETDTVWTVFGMHLLGHLAIFARPVVFFCVGLGLHLSFAALCVIFLSSQILLALQFTPSGIGTLDGSMFALITLADLPISTPQCAAYLLFIRCWDALIVAIGAAIAARAGMRLLNGIRRPSPGGADALGAPAATGVSDSSPESPEPSAPGQRP